MCPYNVHLVLVGETIFLAQFVDVIESADEWIGRIKIRFAPDDCFWRSGRSKEVVVCGGKVLEGSNGR